jgi:hypothetical protein
MPETPNRNLTEELIRMTKDAEKDRLLAKYRRWTDDALLEYGAWLRGFQAGLITQDEG